MKISSWPAASRPREKLIQQGGSGLSDAELLAIFLGSGRRGLDAVGCAQRLLNATGGLRALLEMDVIALSALDGLGPARSSLLKAALELSTRFLQGKLARGALIQSPEQAGDLFALRLRALKHEAFACLFLDTRHRLMAYECLFFGTIDSAQVHPREVVRRALHHNSAAVIIGHNHPSGISEPSQADKQITLRIRDALALVDIRLLDHFVVGDGPPVSLAARGDI